MTTDTDRLIAIAEEANFLVTSAVGLCDDLQIPGVRGRISPVAHPIANIVGRARLTTAATDGVIDRVIQVFAAKAVPFAWVTGPPSRPSDLADRLRTHGFVLAGNVDMLAKTFGGAEWNPGSDFAVRRARADELPEVSACIAEAYRLPRPVADFVLAVSLARPDVEPRVYCAFGSSLEPVSFLITFLLPGGLAFFRGAGTIPAYRGRGIFSRVLAHALTEVRGQGAAIVVLQSNPQTSGGIFRAAGFTKVCEFQTFVWLPRRRDGLAGRPDASA